VKVVFDSQEIARRALVRASAITEDKKRKKKLFVRMGIVGGTCSAALLMVLANFSGLLPGNLTTINEGPVPLAGTMPSIGAQARVGDESRDNIVLVMPGFDNVEFAADTTEVAMRLENPLGNPGWLSFEVQLADTGEVLYQSDLIAQAGCVENITLARPLAKGEYEAVLIISAFELDSLAQYNTVSVRFKLIAI